MLKALRKYNKWILIIGGTLLMMAWLVQPTIQQIGGDPASRVVATLDGVKLRFNVYQLAAYELAALERYTGGLLPGAMGIQRKDEKHWIILTREAAAAGFIGEDQDGPEWTPELAEALANNEMSRQLGPNWRQFLNSNPQFAQFIEQQYTRALQDATSTLEASRVRVAQSSQLTERQFDKALAKARGVFRMFAAYQSAARLSDRQTAAQARRFLDSAFVDYVFFPASIEVGKVPEPDDAALAAHLERFKDIRPGEGEFGIGYLLPSRLRLEWLTLDAAAIESTIALDPVAVNKRYLADNKNKYKGDFPAERPNVERDMRAERVSEIMTEAHRTIQAEVLKVTRRLETDGRYKKLPADWSQTRPKFEDVAQAVVDQVRKSTGITIPLPVVTIKAADWMTAADLAAEPGIGSSTMRAGNLTIPIADALWSVRELEDVGPDKHESPLAFQVALPIVDSAFTDSSNNRHFVTVLEARRESPPDSIDEIREDLVADYKKLRAYEGLAARLDEFRSLAVSNGLQAVVDLVAPRPPEPFIVSPYVEPDETAGPGVRTRVQVGRENLSGTAPDAADVNVPPVRDAVLAAAAALDPTTPPSDLDPERTTLAVAAPSRLGVAVLRITALRPATLEQARLADGFIASRTQADELTSDDGQGLDFPFSLARLLERHTYVEVRSGSDEPETPEDAPPAPVAPAPIGG